MYFIKIIRQRYWWPSELYTSCFCSGDSFRLPLPDTDTLIFCNVTQQHEYNVADQCAQKILFLPCIKQRHINNNDICTLFLCDNAPLLIQVCIIPAQPVNGLHKQDRAVIQPPQQPLILGPVKILSRLFIYINLLIWNTHFFKCNHLPIFFLLMAAHTGISKNFTIYAFFFHFCHSPFQFRQAAPFRRFAVSVKTKKTASLSVNGHYNSVLHFQSIFRATITNLPFSCEYSQVDSINI